MGSSYPVKYNGVWLHKNSQTYKAYLEGDMAKVERMLKEQDKAYQALLK